jgi:hypothetical protein
VREHRKDGPKFGLGIADIFTQQVDDRADHAAQKQAQSKERSPDAAGLCQQYVNGGLPISAQ